MQVIVKSRHTRVPAALKTMAVGKIERVRRFFDRIDRIEIEFSEERNPRVMRRHAVDVTLATKAHVLRATANGVDPASAVDAVVDKLERQVLRMKDKLVKRGRSASQPETIRIPERAPRSRTGANNRLESSSNARAVRVRRTGRFSVDPMTPKEAARQMDTTGESFLPFVNAETDQVSVVYRLADGGFGLVEPAE